MVLIGCLIVSKTLLVISLEVEEETRTVLQKSKKYLLQLVICHSWKCASRVQAHPHRYHACCSQIAKADICQNIKNELEIILYDLNSWLMHGLDSFFFLTFMAKIC